MIDRLEEKRPYHIAYLQTDELIRMGDYWDIDHLLYFKLVNICDEYKEKFGSDLIKDLEVIFNSAVKSCE